MSFIDLSLPYQAWPLWLCLLPTVAWIPKATRQTMAFLFLLLLPSSSCELAALLLLRPSLAFYTPSSLLHGPLSTFPHLLQGAH
jgi:hypothetical protein